MSDAARLVAEWRLQPVRLARRIDTDSAGGTMPPWRQSQSCMGGPMSTIPPSTPPPVQPTETYAGRSLTLKTADWLTDGRLQRLMRAIAGEDEDIRIVGGAVRNWLMGLAVADVDLATTALPATVIARARRAGMKPVPTGIEHGTVTVIVDGKPFEVTTLRQDVETDGRHAVVHFGRDWSADAMRRDFTVNALYATADGDIIDLVGGIADCAERRIRFIGPPQTRIREDYLRILRLFRFHASFCTGPIDADGLAAAIAERDGLLTLSSERIGQEIQKLVAADFAPEVLPVMQAAGILTLALATDAIDLNHFARLHALFSTLSPASAEHPPEPPILLLASLVSDGASGSVALAKRLRLSNAARDRMIAAWQGVPTLTPSTDERLARARIARSSPASLRDAVFLAATTPGAGWKIDHALRLVRLADSFTPPRLPISGRDLMALGVAPGRDLGQTLDRLRDLWIDSDFTLTKDQLLAHLDRDT